MDIRLASKEVGDTLTARSDDDTDILLSSLPTIDPCSLTAPESRLSCMELDNRPECHDRPNLLLECDKDRRLSSEPELPSPNEMDIVLSSVDRRRSSAANDGLLSSPGRDALDTLHSSPGIETCPPLFPSKLCLPAPSKADDPSCKGQTIVPAPCMLCDAFQN
ncbi:hypothetical protein O6H91_18G064800 [Diphasiastrum complanatum]|uniref:Uncharacterized protein n=1 Tax=Diphasiastrum complanatum TaxID=34168 RepID=A0ACC2B245_DIPCM|nr:hypothetical protein O6H91_18G064800 [Diphasiastrum complanatum]